MNLWKQVQKSESFVDFTSLGASRRDFLLRGTVSIENGQTEQWPVRSEREITAALRRFHNYCELSDIVRGGVYIHPSEQNRSPGTPIRWGPRGGERHLTL